MERHNMKRKRNGGRGTRWGGLKVEKKKSSARQWANTIPVIRRTRLAQRGLCIDTVRTVSRHFFRVYFLFLALFFAFPPLLLPPLSVTDSLTFSLAEKHLLAVFAPTVSLLCHNLAPLFRSRFTPPPPAPTPYPQLTTLNHRDHRRALIRRRKKQSFLK